MLKSTYIGETSRGGPEKKYDQDRVHSVLISKKLLAWCSGEVSEWRFSTLASCVSGCKGNEKITASLPIGQCLRGIGREGTEFYL